MDHVRYIDRTRDYYLAEGYDKPYVWSHFEDAPFAPLTKPLSECRVTLVSTSDVTIKPKAGEADDPTHALLAGSVYSIPADTPVDELYSRQEHYDTHATNLDDVNSYFPVTRLHEAAAAGRIASVAQRLHGVYTSYSQRRTSEVDGPEVLRRCREDGVDVAVLTPVCPVCHQTISLVGRYLEENGIPTVTIASARDIVEHCGVSRLLFVDFPLGNPCGEPFDGEMQRDVLRMAFDLLENATGPRTTIEAPYLWSKGQDWKGKIFTKEQPFLEGEAHENWINAKADYKKKKAEGKL